MTYPEQLNTIQWKNKRNDVLKRDGFKCQNCSNEKVISELEKGFFTGYCFPNNKKAIHIDNFGIDKFMRSGIKDGYSKFLSESAIVYSKNTPNWRRMVLGVRKLDYDEKLIFDKFHKKLMELQKGNKTSFYYLPDVSTTRKILELKEERRVEFTELNKNKVKTEYDWIFMLGLHIHHKYYIKGLRAWEYKNDALITLCQTCHENLHKDQKIQVYDNKFKLMGYFKYCTRCWGAGVFPEYSHVQNGICFRCNGMRYEELITDTNTL